MPLRRLAILAALLLAPNGSDGAAEPPGPVLRVATFNVRYGLADDGPNRWELRRGLLTKTIAEMDPDVLGLQEALRFQIDAITDALPQYVVLGVGRDDGATGGEFSPILVRTSRFIVADTETFWLSESPRVAGSKSWEAAFPRICTWARLIDRESGQGVYVFNTHFDHASQLARERSAALIVERIAGRARDEPVILMGDFNAGEGNAAVVALLGSADPRARLVDAYRVVHPVGADAGEVVGTFTAFDPANIHGEMIDHVFVTVGLEVVASTIERPRTPDGTRAPSDHDPVTATLRLGD